MARVILESNQIVTDDDNIVKDHQAHLTFQREGGTQDVIIQQADKNKESYNWRNVGIIEDSDTYKQSLALFASQGYVYCLLYTSPSPRDS